MAALGVPHLLHPLLPAWRPARNIVRPIHRQECIAQAAASLHKIDSAFFPRDWPAQWPPFLTEAAEVGNRVSELGKGVARASRPWTIMLLQHGAFFKLRTDARHDRRQPLRRGRATSPCRGG